MRLVARIRFEPPEVGPHLAALEAVMEEALPGLFVFADLSEGLTADEVRTAGARGAILDERSPKMRDKITESWNLTKAAADTHTGSISATWGSLSDAYSWDERPTWIGALHWCQDDDSSITGRLVSLRVDIGGPVGRLAQTPGAADAFGDMLARALHLEHAVCGYCTLTTVQDEPRRFINGFTASDARTGIFGYSWMSWVPPAMASRLDHSVPLGVPAVTRPIVDGSGGVLVVADTPPTELSNDGLRSLRGYLEPVLIPANPDSPARRHVRDVPPGILPIDWAAGT